MRALTLHRPWPWAILHLPEATAKRTENRTWPPHAGAVGQLLALHAGRTFDRPAAEFIKRTSGEWPPAFEGDHPLGVVGVVRLVGVRTPTAPAARGVDRWYAGAFGWQLAEVVALARPVTCNGAQGIWTLPPDVEQAVLAQLPKEARR